MGKSLLSVCSIVFYCHNIKTITGVNHMAERLYTMKDVVDLTGIPATTLRFYDKKGMLAFVKRSVSGVRILLFFE